MNPAIGLLWDALSDNTGDAAVGSVARRCLERMGFSGRVINLHPARPFPKDLSLVWIAGGELLHPVGHPYYDLFRQPGRHVLFSVGTNGRPEVAHLAEYLFSSVRSRADYEALLGAGKSVEVVPCVTLLIDDHAEPRDASPADGRVLVHLHAGVPAADLVSEAEALLTALGPRAALLSFTAYNSDFALLAPLAKAAGVPLLRPSDPDEAFAWIRSARAVVCGSLHATIFAYVAGVPFLTLDYAGKIGRFLDERGLACRRLGAVSEVVKQLDALAPASVTWQTSLSRDRTIVRDALERAANSAEEALASPEAARVWSPGESIALAHSTMLRAHAEHGLRIAERVEHELERRTARAYVQRLEEQLAAHQTENQVTREYVQRLEALRGELEREALVLRADAARAKELETELVGSRAAIARADGPVVHVVIVFSRDAQVLEYCLRAVFESLAVRVLVVVVRNGAETPEVPAWAVATRRVAVLDLGEPRGFAAANNLGIDYAAQMFGVGDFFLFLNDDAAVRPETIRWMVDHLTLHPSCAIVGPRLTIWGAENHLNSLGLNVTETGEAWDEGIGRTAAQYGCLPASREVVAVTGAALMIRPELFRKLGGWSEVYEFYFEDIDLCLRAWRAGFTVRNLPEAEVAHRISSTAGKWSAFKRYLSWRNQLLLLAAHWPASMLVRVLPGLLLVQAGVFVRRLRNGCWGDAWLQVRSWAGALVRLPLVAQTRYASARSGAWLGLLRPAGSVPEIALPSVAEPVAPPFREREGT